MTILPRCVSLCATNSLKNKGVNLSIEGVSIKTDKRWDRGDYLDATQRCVRCLLVFLPALMSRPLPSLPYDSSGFVKAYNNSSFGPGAGVRSHSASSIRSEQHNSEGRERHGTVSGGALHMRKTSTTGSK